MAERYHCIRTKYGDVLSAQSDRAFEQTDSLVQVSSDAVEICEPQTCLDKAERMFEPFRDPNRLASVDFAFIKQASLGEGARQERPGQNRGKLPEAKSLTRPLARQELHQSSAGVFGPSIVA